MKSNRVIRLVGWLKENYHYNSRLDDKSKEELSELQTLDASFFI